MGAYKKWPFLWALILLAAPPTTIVEASFESVDESPSTTTGTSSSSHFRQDSTEPGGTDNKCPSINTPQHNAENKHHQESLVYTTLAGNADPFLERLHLSKQDLKRIWASLRTKAHPEDMLLMLFVGWTTVPAVRAVYYLFWKNLYIRLLMVWTHYYAKTKRLIANRSNNNNDGSQQQDEPPPTPAVSKRNHKFRHSKLFIISDHIQQIAKIALLVYLVDVGKLFLLGMGFKPLGKGNFPHAFAQLAYTLWIAQRLSVAKKGWVRDVVSHHPESYGRMKITNRLINVAITALAGCVVLSILKLQMGVAVHSFLALGSLSTLALTLASKDIVTNILNGFLLASSDRLYEGDFVRFGSGLKGTIDTMGWMETVIRGEDEVMISVPHSDLVKQHVANLSRVRYSQVYQVVKFKYKDADKLPDLLTSIKNEIFSSCPSLITDGERPFRVYWSDYGSDSLEVTIDAHFRLRRLSEEYHDNRQRVLIAIQRAVKSNGLTFAKE